MKAVNDAKREKLKIDDRIICIEEPEGSDGAKLRPISPSLRSLTLPSYDALHDDS